MTFRQNFNINVKITAMGTLGGPLTALVDGMAGSHAGGLAIRPIGRALGTACVKAAEQVGANARKADVYAAR